jgi:hypothetical protein
MLLISLQDQSPDRSLVINSHPLSNSDKELSNCLPSMVLQKGSIVGMGEISKQRQLNEKIQYGMVRDLSFYETRWILKFSFKHSLMNEIERRVSQSPMPGL